MQGKMMNHIDTNQLFRNLQNCFDSVKHLSPVVCKIPEEVILKVLVNLDILMKNFSKENPTEISNLWSHEFSIDFASFLYLLPAADVFVFYYVISQNQTVLKLVHPHAKKILLNATETTKTWYLQKEVEERLKLGKSLYQNEL